MYYKYFICCLSFQVVALEIAQAASFLTSNSPSDNNLIIRGIILASITCCVCFLFPAVILEIVQAASFRIVFL